MEVCDFSKARCIGKYETDVVSTGLRTAEQLLHRLRIGSKWLKFA